MLQSGYKDKQVLVTGAASGMGRKVAELLIEAGAKVIGADIRPVEMSGIDGRLLNLLDEQSITDFAANIDDATLDAVFHCAGLPQTFPAQDVVTVNFLGARYFLESIVCKVKLGGAVAIISSLTMSWPQIFQSKLKPIFACQTMKEGRDWVAANAELVGDPYIFSKEAIAAYATMTAVDWIASHKVRLNILGPGLTSTPMMPHFEKAVGEALKQVPMPIGRQSTAEEQANVMLFLNHPAATYLVGVTLFNDGGASAAIMSAVANGLVT
jgi:NAD(P)-dependent dehydrogenase (short-subunit alcohol dehydrogenase family)